MSKSSFRVYVDESGDEGFVFHTDGTGSSRWLVLSAVMVRTKNDLSLVKLVGETRKLLGRQPGQHLHFRDLKHAQRVPYIRQIAKEIQKSGFRLDQTQEYVAIQFRSVGNKSESARKERDYGKPK